MTSRSSILSASAAIPAMIEVSFGVGFHAVANTITGQHDHRSARSTARV